MGMIAIDDSMILYGCRIYGLGVLEFWEFALKLAGMKEGKSRSQEPEEVCHIRRQKTRRYPLGLCHVRYAIIHSSLSSVIYLSSQVDSGKPREAHCEKI